MWTPKRMLAGKALLILLFAGALSAVNATTDLKLGLDLKGGTQLDYTVDLTRVPVTDQDQVVEGVKEVIRRRVDSLGVSEPSIYVSDVGTEKHIIVELAGINDLEEAKAVVGKTIQLEFREEEPNPDNSAQMALAQSSADAFLKEVQNGADFKTLGESSSAKAAGQAQFTPYKEADLDNLPEGIQDAIKGHAAGDLIGPMDLDLGYTYDANSGQLVSFKGKALIQMGEQKTVDEEKAVEESVDARHILIAWEGTGAQSETKRTKEEAYTLITSLKDQINEGASFEELAKEYSDDKGSGSNGGDLGNFGKGKMVKPFEDAAFALEVDQLSDIVESEFGYHLIQVYKKQAAGTITESKEKVSANVMAWSTTASPWKETASITGEHFKHADIQFNQAYQPLVSITFTEEGGKLFEELTEKNVGKRIAIFVGGQMVSAPNVNEKITGGQAQITGNFTLEDAQNLARDLNTGAIPAPVELSGQHNISATLGQEALDQSLFGGMIGVIVLAVFMILYYRLPGVIATVALGVYALLLMFIIKTALPVWASLLISMTVFGVLVKMILGNKDSGGEKTLAFVVACFVLFLLTLVLSSQITLTLAGVAGVVLSIGMAVDANVLIFERMKEELAHGKSLQEAIEEGFSRAWDSIRDSNFSSLITCAILFYFGSSIIRGFATNLALGILISMFSAIMLTRTLLGIAAETRLAKSTWLWGKGRKTNSMWQIMRYSPIWMGISGALALAAVVSIGVFGFRLGLDFTGGTSLEVKLNNQQVSSEAVKEVVLDLAENEGVDLGEPQVLTNEEGVTTIRLKHITEEERAAIVSKLKESSPELEEVRFTTVGPTIGDTLKNKAIFALGLTSLMIVLYIAFAFRSLPKEVSAWKFGLSAIVALLHDVLMVIGLFVALGHFYGVEIDALFITALLTVMGFSIHDTIVVFDRIRENLKYREAKETLEETTNKALNQTMARSINTSVCTLITIVALLIFGAESIRMFVLALTVGITAGTYSSIFIASPLMVWWSNWDNRNKKA